MPLHPVLVLIVHLRLRHTSVLSMPRLHVPRTRYSRPKSSTACSGSGLRRSFVKLSTANRRRWQRFDASNREQHRAAVHDLSNSEADIEQVDKAIRRLRVIRTKIHRSNQQRRLVANAYAPIHRLPAEILVSSSNTLLMWRWAAQTNP